MRDSGGQRASNRKRHQKARDTLGERDSMEKRSQDGELQAQEDGKQKGSSGGGAGFSSSPTHSSAGAEALTSDARAISTFSQPKPNWPEADGQATCQ